MGTDLQMKIIIFRDDVVFMTRKIDQERLEGNHCHDMLMYSTSIVVYTSLEKGIHERVMVMNHKEK